MVIILKMKINCLKHGYQPKNKNKLFRSMVINIQNENKLFKTWL